MTILAIGFLQPLVMLIGGFTLIAGVLAWIYADLPEERQNAWEARVAHFMEQLTAGLRKQPKPGTAPPLDAELLPKITRSSSAPPEWLDVARKETRKE
jgi:hypothetical protein